MEKNENLIKKEVGRPIKMTKETLQKLEEVFALGGTDLEACFYGGISKSTLYNYLQENTRFMERKELLKQTPILKARRTFINSLDDPNMALKYLERKLPKEFNLKQVVDIKNGSDKDNDLHELTMTIKSILQRRY